MLPSPLTATPLLRINPDQDKGQDVAHQSRADHDGGDSGEAGMEENHPQQLADDDDDKGGNEGGAFEGEGVVEPDVEGSKQGRRQPHQPQNKAGVLVRPAENGADQPGGEEKVENSQSQTGEQSHKQG